MVPDKTIKGKTKNNKNHLFNRNSLSCNNYSSQRRTRVVIICGMV